jgi:hypothetical protein
MSAQRLFAESQPEIGAISNSHTDDECLEKLAALIQRRSDEDLGELMALLGRLAVVVE